MCDFVQGTLINQSILPFVMVVGVWSAESVGTLIIMDCFNIDKQAKISSNKVPKHVHFREPYDGQLNSSKVLIVILFITQHEIPFLVEIIAKYTYLARGQQDLDISSILLWSVFLSAAIECISHVMLALIF